MKEKNHLYTLASFRSTSAQVILGIFLSLATLSNTWTADYQYIGNPSSINWTNTTPAYWNQNAPWDGTPSGGVGPQATDNLDLAGEGALILTGGTPAVNFAVNDLSADLAAEMTIRSGGGTAILTTNGNLTLSANSPSLTLRNQTDGSNMLIVSVEGDVNVGTNSTLSLGSINATSSLTQFTVAETTEVSGTLLNHRFSTATNLGDLKINSGGSVIALEAAGATLGLITLTLSSRSLSGSGSLYGSSITGNNTRNATLAINTIATTDANFSGSLIDSSVITTGTGNNILAVTVSGSGRQTFSGSNTYTGQTLVSAGTLLVSGTHVQSKAGAGGGDSADGLYRVADGATLGGSGLIAGNGTADNTNMILVQAGGNLAPDLSIEALTLDGASISGSGSSILNMADGAEFTFELDGNNSGRISFWNYTGAADFLRNNNRINLTLDGAASAGTYTVTLFDFFDNDGTNATASGFADGLTLVGASMDPNISSADLIFNTNSITLEYTVIPEPSTWALITIGLCAVTLLRRRSNA